MLTLRFGDAVVRLEHCWGAYRGQVPIREFCDITYELPGAVGEHKYAFAEVGFEWHPLKQRFVLRLDYDSFFGEVRSDFPEILVFQNLPLVEALQCSAQHAEDGMPIPYAFWFKAITEIEFALTETFRSPRNWLERKYRDWVWRLYEYLFGRFACYGNVVEV